ncbi:ribonuclease T2 family protein [Undibacterium sp. Di26W]|uniref:ribonuclease T2 family protein n=1 Tax=Undibacterium sp. Di26W TaxID=3413035 RepID=UPI003BF365AC
MRKILLKQALLLLAGVFSGLSAYASERAAGSFTAGKSCDLYASFAKSTNPDSAKTKPGLAYDIREINKANNFEWIRVDVPEASPRLRWVARDCGSFTLDEANKQPASAKNNGASAGDVCSTPNKEDSYVLAITWQPGFCEHFPYKGKKPECDAIHNGELVVSNLTLHGLWPNKKECGINYGNCPSSPLRLSKDSVSRISPWMPNFMYETKFGEYEWQKHGACQARDADTYFRTAVAAVEEVNNSMVGKFILSRVGKSFAAADFFADVKKNYGDNVAKSIMLSCAGGKYLQEIRFHLPLNFETGKGLEKLIGQAEGFSSQLDKCGADIVVESSGKSRQ